MDDSAKSLIAFTDYLFEAGACAGFLNCPVLELPDSGVRQSPLMNAAHA